jgi:hypothetical protein
MTDFFRDLVPLSTPLPAPDPFGRARGMLNPGDNLFSATRAFKLAMQGDGNLVLYVIDDSTLPLDITQGSYTKPIWASETQGISSGKSCVMQTDGNLVIPKNTPFASIGFATGTSGHEGQNAFLRVQDDGNLVIYLPNGAHIWDSGTYARPRGQ